MDKSPKRRKSKDNPYTLESIEEKKIYRISFSDGIGNHYKLDVDSEIFKALNQFELDDLKELNEFDRHIEHLEQTEESIYKRTQKEESIDDYIIRKSSYEDLMNVINKLSNIQKRRIRMYYFEDMTLKEIATKENCSKVAIKHSLDDAIEKLKKILKN